METTQDAFKSFLPILIFGVVVAASIGAGATYFFTSKQKNIDETKILMAQVAKLIELPQGEEPRIATVSDKERLSGQAFFAQAQNGDKVLIYATAGKAILYRPTSNKIIEVAPLESQPEAAAVAPPASPSASPKAGQKIKAVLYNGTTTVGLTATAAAVLKSTSPEVEVVDRDDAKRKDYQESLIINLGGRSSEVVDKISQALGGKISDLPSEEKKPPDVDILIILGQDFLQSLH